MSERVLSTFDRMAKKGSVTFDASEVREPSKEDSTPTGGASPAEDIFRRRKRASSLDFRKFLPERFSDVAEHYHVEKSAFGEGGYGSVFLAQDKESKRTVAIKKVTVRDQKSRETFEKEIKVMKELDHPNICKLLETFSKDKWIFFVMEFCEGGELFDRIVDNGCISEPLTVDIVGQVSSALRYAHGRQIAHRDMKPENICLCSKNPENTQVKVIDWGLSALFNEAAMKTAVGSLSYAAPEVLQRSPEYGCECDIWSLGVVAYVMLCGKPPFWGSQKNMISKMMAHQYPMTGEPWPSISDHGKEFLRGCLKANPQERLSIEAVLESPWLKSQPTEGVQEAVAKQILKNMKKFSNFSLFRSMCAASVARQLDHNHLQDIHKVFRDMDVNGDGVLSLEEVAAGFRKIYGEDSPGQSEIEEFFKSADLDGSGEIDYTEFCAAGMGRKAALEEDVLWAAFRQFDQTGTGKISVPELTSVLQSVNVNDMFTKEVCEEVAEEILKKYDADGDGGIDFSEWQMLMRTKSAAEPNYNPDEQPALKQREISRALNVINSQEEAYQLLLQVSPEVSQGPKPPKSMVSL